MRHEDGTFDNVEIAEFEHHFALLADAERSADPPWAAHDKIATWRDYHQMSRSARRHAPKV